MMNSTDPPAAGQPFWSVPLSDLFRQCRTSEQGLSSEDARDRLKKFGPNRLKPKRQVNAIRLFLSQFTSPIILILLFAAVLSFFLGDPTDSIIIMVIVFFSGALGFWQEYEASNAVEDLMALVQLKAMVVRDGREVEVPFEEVVPGDTVVLNAGDGVPGDGRIIESKELFIEEAALTGESYPAEKVQADLPAETELARRTNTLFMGTHVRSGSAKMLVVRTGRATEFGKVSERLKFRQPETEFEHGVRQFGYLLMEVTMLLIFAIFAINVYLNRPVLEAFIFSLALAVGLTPQLLPAIISINLATRCQAYGGKKGHRQTAVLHRELRQHERALFGQDRHHHRRHRQSAFGGRRRQRPQPEDPGIRLPERLL